MSMIYADKTQARFFLISSEDAEHLPAGSFEIASMTGNRRSVDEQAVTRFEMTEAKAKQYVGEKLTAVQHILAEIATSLGRLLTDAEQLTAPGGRFMTLLAAVGVRFEELQHDTAATVAKLRKASRDGSGKAQRPGRQVRGRLSGYCEVRRRIRRAGLCEPPA